ncbi:MAG: hypothetical protein DMF61_17825 [Blastocatellia bacterium AA13]|nr:MAG: hypothetical protein DMF61_17825 [Blastocatellia bacterium AA13]
MILTLIKNSLTRGRGRSLIAVAAVALGASVATAMLAVALGIGDKVNRELRSFGANIEVLPRQRSLPVIAGGVQLQAASVPSFLNEKDLPTLRSIFWAHNLLAFSPFLNLKVTVTREADRSAPPITRNLIGGWIEHELKNDSGESFVTGMRQLSPFWKIDGKWPSSGECLVGSDLAARLKASIGEKITMRYRSAGTLAGVESLTISGITTTGSAEDDSIIAPLEEAQRLARLEGRFDRLEVSALTRPDDEFGKRDPETLSSEDLERWSCTPYARSIARDIEKAVQGSEAHPVLKIAQSEGTILNKVNLLLFLVLIASVIAAILGVSSTMMTTVIQRRAEVGLLRAIGAGRASVSSIFLLEAGIIGLAGGLAGIAIGALLAQFVARTVFASSIEFSGLLVPLMLLMSVVVALTGSAFPLRKALSFEPSIVLRER